MGESMTKLGTLDHIAAVMPIGTKRGLATKMHSPTGIALNFHFVMANRTAFVPITCEVTSASVATFL